MKIPINIKFIFAYIAFGIAGFILVSTFTYRNAFQRTLETRAASLYKQAYTVSDTYANDYYNSYLSLDDVQSLLSRLDSYLGAQIWIVSPNGQILVNSRDADAFENAYTFENFDITGFGSRTYQTGTFYNYFSEQQLSVYAPITRNYSIRGYVFIHIPLTSLESDAYNLLNTAYLTYLLIMLILLALLLLQIFTGNRNIRKISRISAQYAKGVFEKPLVIRSNDEIGQIAASVSFMAHQLDTLEEDQRKFISNVSHDFRSPLTSLKGYVEAILDGTIPPEMQEKYLKIVLFEAERLTKLSESLLELNKFGAHGTMLDVTDFDINETIKQTVRTFEGVCLEKNIIFNLTLTGESLFVSADKGKIQQVLYNLVDNAMKFSAPHSSIDIDTAIKNGKVFISVKDHGVGIPKENLSKIWERFYKSDRSRGKDKKGTGLGLSIVRDIILSHGENINVVSTVNAGTEFIFTLSASERDT